MFTSLAMARPSLAVFPPGEWKDMIGELSPPDFTISSGFDGCAETAFMSVAPKGMNQIFNAMCGSCANETAFKAAFSGSRVLSFKLKLTRSQSHTLLDRPVRKHQRCPSATRRCRHV